MSFLQPLLLVALPLIALPVIIHLVNQRRYQTMPWAAMIFLLAANRLSQGFARLRQWLILAARTLVIAGLIFAIARPVASGWLGLAAGSKPDTTIILFDRSPSMATSSKDGVGTKLDTGRRYLQEALEKLGSDHWIVIDSATLKPIEIESPQYLLEAPELEPTGSSANLPSMLRAAYDYVKANLTGRTDIWICSDMRSHDWDAEGSEWPAIRQSFLELPQPVRFYLLAFPETPEKNASLRVTEIFRTETGRGARLLVSLDITRSGKATQAETVPIEFDIDGARSVLDVEVSGKVHELKNHEIPLGVNQVQGWGRVALAADANDLDNEYFFVFDEPPVRKTLLVSEQAADTRPLKLAAEIATAEKVVTSVETVSPAQLSTVVWEELGLVLWQAPLPTGREAELLRSFVSSDGQIIFLPPRSPGANSFFGFSWKTWKDLPEEAALGNWRGEADLLARTQNGAALPVGELKVRRVCDLEGDVTALATLSTEEVLLARVPTARGGVYALATTADERDSSLATDGVVLYVMVQRALSTGCERLGNVRQKIAGTVSKTSAGWDRLAGAEQALSHQYAYHAGVYRQGEKLLALNRSRAEDSTLTLSSEETASLFEGLDWVRFDSQADDSSSLLNEIWRLFLVVMLIALLAEATMCLPKQRPAIEAAA